VLGAADRLGRMKQRSTPGARVSMRRVTDAVAPANVGGTAGGVFEGKLGGKVRIGDRSVAPFGDHGDRSIPDRRRREVGAPGVEGSEFQGLVSANQLGHRRQNSSREDVLDEVCLIVKIELVHDARAVRLGRAATDGQVPGDARAAVAIENKPSTSRSRRVSVS